MAFTKITSADLANKGVVGLPDTPGLSTSEMQEKFDEIATDVIVPKFNNLCDELDAMTLDDAILSEDVTNIRLNSDNAIETSSDGGETWEATASSGHRIMDGSGTIYTQRTKLQFSNNVTIRDDDVNGSTQLFFQPGEKGDKGDAATITVGTVQSGVTPTVTNSGSSTDAIFNFTFPKGDAGSAATIQVGTVTKGENASVTNRGTSSTAIFDFTLPKGDKGDTGQGINILGEYATLADLQAAHPTGNAGNAYMVGATNPKDLYIWDVGTSAWKNQGQLQGVKGDTGSAATITIGTVTSGSTMAVVNSGTTSAAVLDFTLQKGDKGDTGNTGTIAVGTVTSGQTASVTNSGTPTAAIFDFVIPKGDKGEQGNPTTVNGKSGNNVTLYGSDLDMNTSDSTKVDAAINALADENTVTTLAVDLQNWSSDTTSQSGTTLYKKEVSVTHAYAECPTIDIGCASGSTLPTVAEQTSYNLIQYATVDDTVPCIYLYASAIPTTAFYINVKGVD